MDYFCLVWKVDVAPTEKGLGTPAIENACRSFLTHLWKLGVVIQKLQFLKMHKRYGKNLNGIISKHVF